MALVFLGVSIYGLDILSDDTSAGALELYPPFPTGGGTPSTNIHSVVEMCISFQLAAHNARTEFIWERHLAPKLNRMFILLPRSLLVDHYLTRRQTRQQMSQYRPNNLG